jgi:putative SOS response-associated peptidase YedK
MCGRYGFIPGENFYSRFGVQNRLERLEAHYNAAPGMMMPVIVKDKAVETVLMKWGLIPSWAKDPKIGYKMINARAESILEKPSFGRPFARQRCLIPAVGFYEWKTIGDDKVPYFIRLKNTDFFGFAGLYDIWKDTEGYPLQTFTIITTTPNNLLSGIHNRMPVILDKDVENIWLDRNYQDINKLAGYLKPYNEDQMEAYPVSKAVNNPVNDNPEIISKIL